jgi:hypothetical protein
MHMRAISVKSVEVLDEELQLHVHHTFGMEQHSDYVFKPGGGKIYSATIVMHSSGQVISQVTEASAQFPGREFILVDLDTDTNVSNTYRIRDGEILEKKINIG